MKKVTRILAYEFTYYAIRGRINNAYAALNSEEWHELGFHKDGIFRMFPRTFQVDSIWVKHI